MTDKERLEKIREGMEQIVSDMVYGVGAHYTSKEIVARLQEYEDSQGVVIKVKRELPSYGISEVLTGNQQAPGCPFVKAGYVAVMPIKE